MRWVKVNAPEHQQSSRFMLLKARRARKNKQVTVWLLHKVLSTLAALHLVLGHLFSGCLPTLCISLSRAATSFRRVLCGWALTILAEINEVLFHRLFTINAYERTVSMRTFSYSRARMPQMRSTRCPTCKTEKLRQCFMVHAAGGRCAINPTSV